MSIDVKDRKTIELTIKILAVLIALFYFLPIIQIDYLDQHIGISFSSLTSGFQIAGTRVRNSGGKFAFIFALFIPLAIVAILQFVKNNDTVKFGGTILLSVIELIIYIVTTIREYEGIETISQVTFWVILACIFLVIMIISSAFFLKSKDAEIYSDIGSIVGEVKKTMSKVSSATDESAPEKKCPKCGAKLKWNAVFCTKCGTKYVEPIPKKCPHCGTIMGKEDIFCPKCGTKKHGIKLNTEY